MYKVSLTESFPIWPEGHSNQASDNANMRILWGSRSICNVSRPVLMPFFPEKVQFNHTAVIVCPGGAFHFLMIDKEGIDVARCLNSKGIAVFVLQYRLAPTSINDEVFKKETGSFNRQMIRRMKKYSPLAIEDGLQALKIVRQNNGYFDIDDKRIGIVGFSAGAEVAVKTAVKYGPENRPDFVGAIYCPPVENIKIPVDAPLLFIAYANGDEIVGNSSIDLISKWNAMKLRTELHVFSQGGHGFGMQKQGLPSDNWIDLFYAWMKVEGFV